jgi:hypothetical protein
MYWWFPRRDEMPVSSIFANDALTVSIVSDQTEALSAT